MTQFMWVAGKDYELNINVLYTFAHRKIKDTEKQKHKY